MAANTAPIFEGTPKVWVQSFDSGDTTSKLQLAAPGTEGSRIDSIMISSDDTAAVNLAFSLYDTTTDWYIGNVNVPIGSGYTTVARVEGLATLAPVLGYLIVPSGFTLRANCVATMTAAKICTVVCMGGDY